LLTIFWRKNLKIEDIAYVYNVRAIEAYKKIMKSKEEIKDEQIKVKPIESMPDGCGSHVNIFV